MKKILVIVVTYNGLEWIERCLGSVRTSSLPADTIVIDNCSLDGTPDYVEEHFPEVTLVSSPKNLGFGEGNNVGLRKAVDGGYDYAYLLNQDAWLEKDTLELLVSSIESHPGIGILSPLQTDSSGETLDEYFAKKITDHRGHARTVSDVRKFGDRLIEVPFVMAAHWLMSVECIRTVGGFSPLFTHNGEDDNYCDRARYHGWKTGICTSAKAIHDRSTRPMTKDTKMRLSCLTGNLARLANINHTMADRRFYCLIFSTYKSIRYASVKPLKYHISLRSRYKEIRQVRALTEGTGAYL